jgi:hypothetical protein
MPERLSALLVGLLVMLVGIGLFLWDWYGEYIHFFWFIPFFILGPILFVFGLIMIITALLPTKKSFKETTEDASRDSTSKIYYNEKYRFSIQPPSGWEVVDSGLRNGTAAVFWGPKDGVMAPNIFIAVMDAPGLTLEGCVSMAKQNLPLILTNYQFVSERTRVIGGLRAYELVYDYLKGVFRLKGKRVFLLKNRKEYMISLTTLQSEFKKYLPVFESSIDTFEAEKGRV